MSEKGSLEHLLTDKNWLHWRDVVLDKGLEFGVAGRSIRLRKVPEFRMPNLMDERLISTGEVFTREIAAARVVWAVEEFVLEGVPEHIANARAAALFEPVYDSEAEVSLRLERFFFERKISILKIKESSLLTS